MSCPEGGGGLSGRLGKTGWLLVLVACVWVYCVPRRVCELCVCDVNCVPCVCGLCAVVEAGRTVAW